METEHDQFIAEALAADTHIWRVCSWHKTQSDMQPGYRPNEVGWGPYQACQQGRALIATAHEHSYARTRTLTDMGNADAGHGAKGAPDSVEVTHGSSFVFVSGLGGSSKADYHADLHDDDTWWASIYTENRYLNNGVDVADYDYDYGALFITFNVDGDATKARGVFKTIEGDTIDSFEVVTK